MYKRYRLNDWVLDPQMLTLCRDEQEIRLESRVMQVLICLIEHAEQVVSRDMLIAEVWSGGLVSDNAINRIIGLIRQSLGDSVKSPTYIRTVPKKGYVLIADVEVLLSDDVLQEAESHADLVRNTPTETAAPSRNNAKSIHLKIPLITLVVVLIGSVIFWLWAQSAYPKRTMLAGDDIMQVKPLTFYEGQEVDPALSPDGSKLAFAYRPLSSDLWRIRILAIKDQSINDIPQTSDDNMRYPAWSVDGTKLAYLRWGKETGCHIVVYDSSVKDGKQSSFACHKTTQSTSIAWAPSGQALYYVDAEGVEGYKRLFRLNLIDGRREQLSQPHIAGRGDYAMALSPNAEQIAVLRSIDWFDTQVLLFDMNTGEWRNIIRVGYPLRSIAWDQTGSAIIYRGEAGQLYRLNLQNHQIHRITSVVSEINSPVSNAAGQLTAVLGELFEEELWYWPSPRTGKPKRWIYSSRRDYKPAVSHDGTRLLFVSNRSGLPQIWIRHADGRENQLTELQSFSHLDELTFSSDDRLVAGTLNRKAFVLDVASGKMHFPPSMDTVRNVAWSTDNQHLIASEETDGVWQIKCFDIESGKRQLLINEGFVAKYDSNGDLFVTLLHKKGIWQLVNGHLIQINDQYTPRFGTAWQVANGAIWLIEPLGQQMSLVRISLQNHSVTKQQIPMDNVSPLSLSVSDHGDVYLSLLAKANTDIVSVTK